MLWNTVNGSGNKARKLGLAISFDRRIAGFPAAARIAIKARVDAITLAPVDDFRRDSDLCK